MDIPGSELLVEAPLVLGSQHLYFTGQGSYHIEENWVKNAQTLDFSERLHYGLWQSRHEITMIGSLGETDALSMCEGFHHFLPASQCWGGEEALLFRGMGHNPIAEKATMGAT